jgi:hypothetical protein
MDRVQSFWFGFLISGVFGLLSYGILANWGVLNKIYKRMFVVPPQPDLKPLPEVTHKGISTDPNQSPLNVLIQGCLTFIVFLVAQIFMLAALILLFLGVLQYEISQGFWGGVIFAGVAGFLLQNIRKNLKEISNLIKLITKPPNPRLNPAAPPNNHVLATRPSAPAFTLIVNSTIECVWRGMWVLALGYLLYESILIAISYLSDAGIQVSITNPFGT